MSIERLLFMIVGHNGAGKSTFYRRYLQPLLGSEIPHIDPDVIERQIAEEGREGVDSDGSSNSEVSSPSRQRSLLAQKLSSVQRISLRDDERSFSFETVFSDPIGDKLDFLRNATREGYNTVLIAIGLDSPERSKARVALRVSRGGHPVPDEEIKLRYPRVIANITQGVQISTLALLIDNSEDDLHEGGERYAAVAMFSEGALIATEALIPVWCQPILG